MQTYALEKPRNAAVKTVTTILATPLVIGLLSSALGGSRGLFGGLWGLGPGRLFCGGGYCRAWDVPGPGYVHSLGHGPRRAHR